MGNARNWLECDYEEFEIRILQKLVPEHIPVQQWKEYLDARSKKEKEVNQYSKQESKSKRITEVRGEQNIRDNGYSVW